jgi:hypothetical protein
LSGHLLQKTCQTALQSGIGFRVSDIGLPAFLITPGDFSEACLDFVIPSKEGIQSLMLDARFHGHDKLPDTP